MVEESRSPLQLLGAACVLGVLGILLFFNAAYGLNILFWTLAFAGGAVALSRWQGRPIAKTFLFTAPAIVAFAACFAFRESPALKMLNGFALFLLVGALLVRTKSGSMSRASLWDLSLKAVGAWFKLTADFAQLVVKEVNWSKSQESKARAIAIIRGCTIALPLLAIFAALFVSADDAFQTMLSKAFSFDWLNTESLLQTTLIFLFCVVMAAGTYRVMLQEHGKFIGPVPPPKVFGAGLDAGFISPTSDLKLGMTETAVIFGLLNALFGLFVLVQAQYFFGGAHHVKMVGPLTYAEYARHGFFELTAVAGGAVATILGFYSLLRDPVRNQKSFSILAGILSSFVAVVLASAFLRMNLYIQFAGLTELRVYTTSTMVWIGMVLVWLIATILRGRKETFAIGAFAAGLAAIFALNIVNPDAVIARYNLAVLNRKVDVNYLESLSVDAAPAIISGAGQLPAAQSATLKKTVRTEWSKQVDTDWRGINYARWRFLNDYRGEL